MGEQLWYTCDELGLIELHKAWVDLRKSSNKGVELKMARKACGLRVGELANALSALPSSVSRWEACEGFAWISPREREVFRALVEAKLQAVLQRLRVHSDQRREAEAKLHQVELELRGAQEALSRAGVRYHHDSGSIVIDEPVELQKAKERIADLEGRLEVIRHNSSSNQAHFTRSLDAAKERIDALEAEKSELKMKVHCQKITINALYGKMGVHENNKLRAENRRLRAYALDSVKSCLNYLAEIVYENAVAKKFHPTTVPNMCANLHGEVSELWEAYRNQKLDSACDKTAKMIDAGLPTLDCKSEELADIIIRALDSAKALGVNIGNAVIIKHRFNMTRPEKHGGKVA